MSELNLGMNMTKNKQYKDCTSGLFLVYFMLTGLIIIYGYEDVS